MESSRQNVQSLVRVEHRSHSDRRVCVSSESGSAIPTNEGVRPVSKAEPTTGLESTTDAVNRKAGVALAELHA